MSRLLRDSTISLVDQAMLSLANLLVGVFLIQNTGKEDYGIYVIAYAVILYVVGVQNAIVTTQMTVMAPRKPHELQPGFCGSLAVGQYLIFMPLAMLAVGIGVVASNVGWLPEDDARMVIVIATATLGVLLREFARGLFFLKLRPGVVLALDLVNIVLLFGGLFIAQRAAPELLHVLAIAAFGVSSLVSGALALGVARLPLRQVLAEQLAALRDAWVNGRWALGGVSVTWIQDQSYVYLLSLLAGAASTAEANAARLLLVPVMLLNTGVTRITMPHWAILRHNGKRAEIEQTAGWIWRVLVLLIGVYVGALLLGQDVVIPFLFSAEYESIGSLILLWGVILGLQIVRSSFSIMLQVYQQFRQITVANVFSAVIVVALGLVLIPALGVEGSLIAMLLGEIVLTVLLVLAWQRTQ